MFLSCALLLVSAQLVQAQSLSATRLMNTANSAMLISNASQTGMPIGIYTGPFGAINAVTIDSRGGMWMLGPISIGKSVGASSTEAVRIGSLVANGGTGLFVSMTGTQQSTGVAIRDIGATGTENAGISISSAANGTGTGLRIGGPVGSTRPTLGTGIDIVGGLGMRFNALSNGTGTAIEIGGTFSPRRGIEITVSGSDHVGVLSRANSSGTAIVGIAQSLGSEVITPRIRTGISGYASSNSAVSSDTLVGVFGSSIRAGGGGTQTTAIGVYGHTTIKSTQHAGLSIGVLGKSETTATGQYTAIGGCFLGDSVALSLVAIGGDVILGGSPERIASKIRSPHLYQYLTRTTTHMFDADIAGVLNLRALTLTIHENSVVVNANTDVINAPLSAIIRCLVQDNGLSIGGLSCNQQSGCMLMLMVLENDLTVLHNAATTLADRFILPGGQDMLLVADTLYQFLYDSSDQCWRLVR